MLVFMNHYGDMQAYRLGAVPCATYRCRVLVCARVSPRVFRTPVSVNRSGQTCEGVSEELIGRAYGAAETCTPAKWQPSPCHPLRSPWGWPPRSLHSLRLHPPPVLPETPRLSTSQQENNTWRLRPSNSEADSWATAFWLQN